MKNALALAAFGTAAGLLFCFYALPSFKIVFTAAALCIGIAALLLSLTKSKKRAEAAMTAVVFIFAAVAGLYNVSYTRTHVDAVKAFSGKRAEAVGTVIDVTGDGYYHITLSGDLCGVKSRMSIYSPEPIEYGSQVTVSALVREITDFDDMRYSYPVREYAELEDVSILDVQEASGLAAAVAKIRIYSRTVSQRLVSVCGRDNGGILAAMLCGNTSYLSREIRTDMTRAGIGHILAVSGLHVSVIAGFAAFFLRRFGRIISFACSEAVMVLYVIFSGAKISSVRALIMMSVLLFSNLILQEYSGKESIALCIIIMSLANPYVVASPSFILSVTGVFGAGTAARAVINSFEIKSKIVRGLAVTACAAVCTLPATVCFFDEVSVVSVVTNLLLVPIGSAALCISMLFAVCGCPHILEFTVKIAARMAGACAMVSRFIGSLPGTWMSSKSSWTAIPVILFGAIVLVLYVFTGDVKITVKASVAAYAAALLIILVAAEVESRQVYLNIRTENGWFVCTVSQGKRSVLIASDESLYHAYTDTVSLADGGLPSVGLAVILRCGEDNRTVIKRLSSDVSDIGTILSEDAGADVSAFGVEIKASPEAVQIYHGGGRIFIASRDKCDSADISVSVFDGVSVINGIDGLRIVEGELSLEYRLSPMTYSSNVRTTSFINEIGCSFGASLTEI